MGTQHFDAEYLKDTVWDVVAKGCAAVVAAEPGDPVAYLSLWLHKYVDNVAVVERIKKEKQQASQIAEEKAEVASVKQEKQDELQKQKEKALDALRHIKNDPYELWKACLDAVATFTGCSASYVAAVVDKLWEPKPDPKPEGEEGEEGEEPPPEEEEEEPEPEPEPEPEEEEEAAGDEGEAAEGAEGANAEGGEVPPKKKKEKPPKPINYKKKSLVYVAATPKSEFILNRQLNKKTGPVTFKILLELLPILHVPNVLYKEGTHFFGTLPRLGAYCAIPLKVNTIPPEILSILCADTLKSEEEGTARPFSEKEIEFVTSAANIVSEVMNENHAENIKDYKTEELMAQLKENLKRIEQERKEAQKQERAEKRAAAKVAREAARKKAIEEGADPGEPEPDEPEEPEEPPEENPSEGAEGAEGGEDEVEEEEEKEEGEGEGEGEGETGGEEEAAEGEGEGEEEEEKEEEEAPATEEEGLSEKEKLLKGVERAIEKVKKKIEKLEGKLNKSKEIMEKKSEVVGKLEEDMASSQSELNHMENRLAAIMQLINGVKEVEYKRIIRWPFPPTNVYRIFKGMLHILGYEMKVADNWMLAREIFKKAFFDEIETYDALQETTLDKWKFGKKCLSELKDSMLKADPPLAYLGRQWLVQVKKLMSAGVKHKKLTVKTEAAAKAFAEAELKQLVSEMDLRVVQEEDGRLTSEKQKLEAEIETDKQAAEAAAAAAAAAESPAE